MASLAHNLDRTVGPARGGRAADAELAKEGFMAGEANRSRPLSRRALLEAPILACLPAPAFADARQRAPADPAVEQKRASAPTDACLRYVALEDRALALLDEWSALEVRLARSYPGFIGLPREAQALIPGAGRFAEIEDELERLDSARDALLPQVVRLRCETPGSVVAKLRVAERLIHSDDHPDAHQLIADAVRDLDRLLSV
jgi:hypothetical protein